MTMLLQQFGYLIWLAPFGFGALGFCTLAIFYWRQLRQQRGSGGGVFGAFTAVCGLAFLLNMATQSESLQAWFTAPLDLATGMVPPLLLHLVYREEQCRAAWLRNGFYALAVAAACAMAGVDTGLLPAAWGDPLESAPALLLGGAAAIGLLLQWRSHRQRDVAERRYRGWTRVLLGLMVLASVATLLQLSPTVRLLPDYLLLAFFCVTLYYKERLVFFDLVLKRGRVPGLLAIGAGGAFGNPPGHRVGSVAGAGAVVAGGSLDLRTAGAPDRSGVAAPPLHGRGGRTLICGRGAGGRERRRSACTGGAGVTGDFRRSRPTYDSVPRWQANLNRSTPSALPSGHTAR